MNRRYFLHQSMLLSAGLSWGLPACSDPSSAAPPSPANAFTTECHDLLRTWTDGLLAQQIDDPADPSRHGLLDCPACDNIHGRCMDAVYPFLRMYRTTGEERYLQGALRVMEWTEHNVSQPDGSWTVTPNPKTWRGISVFGAIALAEALHYHGDLLPPAIRQAWTERLGRAGDYIYETFDLTFTNINYGYTALYALSLLGEVLERPQYRARARELAEDAAGFLTEPHHLLFGETKPNSDRQSGKGLYGVDLGYNVEESLNGAVLYAIREEDTALLAALEKSLASHLEFMLPDGAWDNSWGTRAFKWSYWGSRTTDGSQPAYAALADRNPEFATAVVRTTELLRRCTLANGLLAGGPHYAEHELPACTHHTFAHAKPLAYLLDAADHLPVITDTVALPRSLADGHQAFPEIDVHLLARGPWRATVSAYDHLYKEGVVQGIGGSMTVLYHLEAGLLFAASLADYKEVERFNQQPDPDGEDFALTPRVEAFLGETRYSNIYDLTAAVVRTEDTAGTLSLETSTRLADDQHTLPPGQDPVCQFHYELQEDGVEITAELTAGDGLARPALVLPLVSPVTETVERVSDRVLRIGKAGGTLELAASAPLNIVETMRERVFNMVPGVQALPLRIAFPNEAERVSCRITFTPEADR